MKIIYLVVLLITATSASFAQPSKYKVAFNVLQDQKADDYEVYTMNLDGSECAAG